MKQMTILAAIVTATFLLMLDDTAVSVALPTIQRQLGMGLSGAEGAANGYTLALAGFTLLAAKIADSFGARPVFIVGIVVFAMGSLGAGLAWDASALTAFRAIQGAGGGALTPASLAMLAQTFPPHRRGAALGLWTGASATALGFGPLLGAIVTQTLGWRWVFLLNLPLAILALTVIAGAVRPVRRRAGTRFDPAGAALAAGVPVLAVLALDRGNAAGWTSPLELGLIAASTVCLALFIVHEHRTPTPLVNLRIFQTATFTGANIITMLSTAVMCSLYFFLTLYIQQALGYTVLAAGASLLPLTLTIIAVSPAAGRVADRIGYRWPVTLGMILLSASLLALAEFGPGDNRWTLAVELVVAGIAVALGRAPTAAAAMASVSEDDYGMAAGIFATFQATGLALGIAVMGAIIGGSGGETGLIQGFSAALRTNAVVAGGTVLLAIWTLRSRHT